MAELDFSIGQARTPLNLQSGIQTYFQAQYNKRANLQTRKAEKSDKKNEFIRGLVSKNTDPTGKLNREGLIRGMMQRGYLSEVNQMKSDFQKQDMSLAKGQAAKRKAENKMMGRYAEHYLTASDKHNSFGDILGDMTRRGMEIPNQWREKTEADPDVTSEMEMIFTQYGEEAAKKRLQSVTAPQRKPLTEKQVLEEGRREKLAVLSEEFRNTLLPNLDVRTLKTDKNARNQLVKQINESKYWNTPLAKQLVKSLKGKSTNIAEQFELAMQKQDIKGQNRPVPAGQAVELGGTADAVGSLDKIMTVIPALGGTGTWTPITDPIAGLNPWNTRAQAKKQYIATIKQIIGKGLEGGVMRAEDERKYEKIIPKMGDTLDAFMLKAKQLREAIVNKRKFMLQGLGSAGFDVGGFEDIITPTESPTQQSERLRKQYNY